jgi:NodT family efflux transporter outer membrane factor (OMF) lipoprotein
MRCYPALALAAALAACTVGPDYHRPDAPPSTAYKELDGWKPATPREAASGSPWWAIYDDPALDGLERQVEVSNESLKTSEAAYREATAIVDEARAGYFPTVSATASAQRSSTPGGQFAGGGRGGGGGGGSIQNQFALSPTASWVPDIWGRIRRTVELDVATAQASAADLAAAQLADQGTLASDYFQLRIADEQKRVLDATVAADQQSLKIARNQFDAGFAAETDVVTAETQLENAQAQGIALGVQRAAFEHAIAVLVGKPPSDLAIAPLPEPLGTTVPVAPVGVPSALLERRPDIAAAERTMQAANAQIGIAEAAYFPDLTLTATAGFASSAVGNLLSLSNSAWSIGAAATETIFDGGLRGAQVRAARAAYDGNVATYRQTVLTAFQQVEDELAALRILEQQAAAQDVALRSARRAVQLTLNQYQAGTVAYTSVVVAQTTALGDEQTSLSILQSRLVASAALVQALGGGWDASQLPSLGTAER